LSDRGQQAPLGNVLAEFGQLCGTAAGAAARRQDYHTLARQMLGEWLARWPLALKGSHRLGLSESGGNGYVRA
jgi:hypothetical protein